MDVIEDNCVVEVDFTLKTSSGEVLDSSKDDGPLNYIHGKKRISPLLEAELAGKKLGEEFEIVVKPEDGYGVRDESLVQFAKKEYFGDDFDKIQIGMPLEMGGVQGETAVVTAVEIRKDGIVIDANHPLAGETLTYQLKVLSIRKATEEELNS